MEKMKEHWEEVFASKKEEEVSWYQPAQNTSMEIIKGFNLPSNAGIIDIGGGDAHLAENLVKDGYTDISILDISKNALERAKKRLGKKASQITWIEANVLDFSPAKKYDLWHDRATFHFLTREDQIQKYLQTINNSLQPGGFVILATFSEKGPAKCSGIPIKQYSLHQLSELLLENFETLECKNIDHITPGEAIQNFSFCSFKRK